MSSSVLKVLRSHADSQKAAFFPRFFKAGKGEYAEGDTFIGVTVPQMRLVAKEFADLPLKDIETLLANPIHEARAVGLFILVNRYEKGDPKTKKQMVDFYLSHLKGVNNWDLVDLTSYKILGDWLLDKNRSILYRLAKSKNLWEQRISIVTTFAFIRKNQHEDTIKLGEFFLNHKHDLMHKAAGWMLREVGKRDAKVLREFLSTHSTKMPRTMLRYAIEKFSESERKKWMKR